MKTSWKSICGLLVLGSVAFIATGCKSGSGGGVAKFENPFKSFASKSDGKDKMKGDQSSLAGTGNPKPSTVARPEVAAPLGGYGTPGSSASLAGTAPAYQPQNQQLTSGASGLYAQSPYTPASATAADPYAYAAAGAPVASAYDQTSYAAPRTGFQDAAPAAQPTQYGQYPAPQQYPQQYPAQQYPAQSGAGYSVPEAYDGMYQTTALPAGQQVPASPPQPSPYAAYPSQPVPAYGTVTPEQAYPGYAPAAVPAGPYGYR